jgi:DNA-binding Lrp family transcriptional regulator
MDSKKNNIVISFSDYQVPQFKEVKGGNKWVKAGEDNRYPDYLLDLFRRSPKHGSIVRKKTKYVFGKGFGFTDKKQKTNVLDNVNQYNESLNKVGKKSILDLELQGGFYVQIIWTKGKKIGDVIHLDYHKVRSNEDNTEFYYREKGWTGYTSRDDKSIKTYLAFNPESPKGSQVLYYKEYTPGLDVYALPEYINALNIIEADSLITEHILNNAKTGFTASKMVNFFNGEPESEEAKLKVNKDFTDKYSGKKGAKIILSFNDSKDKAPEVLDLGTSDLTKEDFAHVDNLIGANIFKGHQINSPILFGERVQGQLGGRSEMIDAYEIFQNTYVDDKQEAVAEVFNTIGQYKGWSELVIIPKEPIGFAIPDADITALLTDDEKRQKLGLEALKFDAKDPKAILQVLSSLNPKVADAVIAAMADDEIRSLIGLAPKTDEQKQEAKDKQPQPPQPPQDPNNKKQNNFSDYDEVIKMFSEVGEPASSYDILKKKKTIDAIAEQLTFSAIEQNEANILDLVKKDKRITPEVIAETLKYPVEYINRVLDKLEKAGYINTTTEDIGDDEQIIREVVAAPEVKPITTDVFIKYSYEGPYDDKNRDFCRRMLDLDRIYSRSEIEQISQRVGYSVWERRGGFYHNPVIDETTPYCRHSWMQNIVIKRK